ncbi:transport and Golgi organization protein 1 homolog isoform X2 [Stegostoma tigrinum]|uniref:transport and Golgi organization protein 1 homolog isoform X2 n=1 Tax=Stegostoma tigrinum TaxID=3053191 RepID=UPI0028708BBC|nr:transport and Golgi organization protein 1 homolog isoform X2 [Stegostoma tigrinum]
MAASWHQICLSVLLIAAISCKKDQQKLFSNFKRCMDEECSMLMCRGKALQDFTGPDCRFLRFKKGETIYIYYKLAGERNDLWAGSVGSQFGYFPKDLIEVNLVYSTDEVELPAEETDFVCFDGGPDEFDYVDLDHLTQANRETMSNEEKSESRIVTMHGATKKREEDTGQGVPAPEVPENNLQGNKARDDKEAVNFVGRSLSDSPSGIKDERDENVDNEVNDEQILHVEDGVSEGKPANVGENASSLEEHPTEEDGRSHVKVSARSQPSSQGIQTSPLKENEDLSDDTEDTRVSWNEAELLDTREQRSQRDKREDVFELEGSLKLDTTFGSTLDAVVVDDEMSSKVTVLDEDPVFDFELQKDELVESPEKVDHEEIALLTYSDSTYQHHPELPEEDHIQDNDIDVDHAVRSHETNYTAVAEDANLAMTFVSPGKEQLDEVMEESVSIRGEGDEKLQAGNSEGENSQNGALWTTLGDTFNSVVRGGETTSKIIAPHDSDSKDIQKDMNYRNTEDSGENDLVNTPEKEIEEKVVNTAAELIENDAVKERSRVTKEGYEMGDTIETFARTSEADNFETHFEENEGTEQDQGIMPQAERQISGLERKHGLKTNDSTLTGEADTNDLLKMPEKDNQTRKVELQTLKHSSTEDKSEAMTNQGSQKFMHLQQEPEMEKLIGSQSKWSINISAEISHSGNEELRSQNQSQLVINKPFSAEDLNDKKQHDTNQAREHVVSPRATNEKVEGLEMVNKEFKNLEESDSAKNNQGDGSLSLDRSNSKLTDDISDQLQEKKEEDIEIPEDFNAVDAPEELLEDENAAEARMAQNIHSNTTNDEEEISDGEDLADDDVHLEEEMNTVEPEDQEDDTDCQKEILVEKDRKEHSKLAHTFQVVPKKIESQRELETHLRPVQESALNVDNEEQSQHLKDQSEMSQKGAGKGHKTDESTVDESTQSEMYSSVETKLNPFEVENKAKEPVHQKTEIRSEKKGSRYNEAVEQLTILKGYLDEKSFQRLYVYLDPQQVLELEAMLHDLEDELMLSKLSRTNEEDIEKALDQILEGSETRILDMVENILDKRQNHWQIEEESQESDGESLIMNDLQELIFQIREKSSGNDESVALTPRLDIPQENKDLSNGLLQGSNQEDQEREAAEAQQGEKNDGEPVRRLHSPVFTKDALHSARNKEEDEGERPWAEMQSGKLSENAAYPETEDDEHLVSSSETVKETEKEHPISESMTGQEEEAPGIEQSSSNFTEIGQTPKDLKGNEEALGMSTPTIKRTVEENHKGTSEWNKPKEHEREASSPGVGGKLDGGHKAWTELNILNISEGGEEPQKGPSDMTFEENVAQCDGGDVAEESLLKGKQREVTVPAGDGVEFGHLETEAGTHSILDKNVVMDTNQLQERGPFLLWTVTVMDAVVLFIKGNVWPVIQSLSEHLISSLPEEMRPGPDFHGVPWEPILMTSIIGIVTFVVFLWRTCLSVKSRKYQMTEKQLSEKIKQLIQEKTEVLEKVSTYEKKLEEAKSLIDEAQNVKSVMSDEAKELKLSCGELEQVNLHLEMRVKNLETLVEKEKKETAKQQTLIADTQKSVKKLQDVISARSAELSQVQEALSSAKANEEKLQVDLQSMQEENLMLKQSKSQLLQEVEGWSERHSELNEQIKLGQKAQRDLEEMLAYKDNEIEVLTDCVMQLRQLDIESDTEDNGWEKEVDGEMANGELPDKSKRIKVKIQQMMDVSRVQTTLKIIEEEKDHFQAKLTDEIKARHELEEQIKQLEHNFVATTTEKSRLENEHKTMQQKLEILSELYHQKEMALQKRLTQEECQRQEKELKLSAADEKALQAVEEVKMYKQRIQEMEEELHKTERSFKNQIAAHEKKAHENWLSARSAERTLTEEKRETANLRQKMIELNQKLSQVQRPSIIKPLPGRPDLHGPPGAPPPLGAGRRGPLSRDGSYGPSPVSGGAPSPPLMMELPVRPPSVNAGRGFPRDRGDGGVRVPPGTVPPREWIGPDRLGPSSDQGSPPPQWDRRPGPVDGYSGPRRPPSESGVTSGRISGPGEIRGLPSSSRAELGPGGPAPLASGPRTSSPNLTESPMANANTVQAAPSFPGTPIMNSPVGGIPVLRPRPGPPPPLTRGTYGPVPLAQNHLVRVPALRDYPPGPFLPPGPFPPPGHRPFLPGPLLPPPPPPHAMRDFPPGAREYPHGPRSLPPGPTPPPGSSREPDNRS